MKCPRDGKELEITTYDEASIYLCSVCMGIWIDIDSSLIDEVARDEIRRAARNKKTCSEIECLHDNYKLLELAHNDVLIDVCPECYGIWLDEGELQKIRNEIDKHSDAKIIAGSLLLEPGIVVDVVPVVIRHIGKALAALTP